MAAVVQKGGKPVVKLSEAELALRKSEMSRKRKHQSDKKLEDEVSPLPLPPSLNSL